MMQHARILMSFPDDPRFRNPRALRKGAWPHRTVSQPAPGDRWYVLWVNGGRENGIHDELRELGFEAFLPVAVEKRLRPVNQRIRGRSHFVTVRHPLFPNYVFVSLSPDGPWGAVLGLRDVREVMSNDGAPRPIPAILIENLRAAVADGAYDAAVVEGDRLAALIGQKVTLHKGAFAGREGVVIEAAKAFVSVEVDLLGRKTRIRMPRKAIEKDEP